jgi:AhpC/TSA family
VDLVIFGLTLPWLIVTMTCWIVYQLVRQDGRILMRLERLEAQLSPPSAPSRGLAIGSIAPAFELPDLDGRQVKLEQFRGKRVLLIFVNPACGFCQQMAPALAALPAHAGRVSPAPGGQHG